MVSICREVNKTTLYIAWNTKAANNSLPPSQTNETLERFHGTLEAMLTKARNSVLDWVDQVPLALVAMRQCPSKTTGFSPAELVYGRKTLGPLDFLYYGWKEQSKELRNVSDIVEQLCDKLEVIREVVREKQLGIVDERKRIYDKGKKRREYEVNDLVLCRFQV